MTYRVWGPIAGHLSVFLSIIPPDFCLFSWNLLHMCRILSFIRSDSLKAWVQVSDELSLFLETTWFRANLWRGVQLPDTLKSRLILRFTTNKSHREKFSPYRHSVALFLSWYIISLKRYKRSKMRSLGTSKSSKITGNYEHTYSNIIAPGTWIINIFLTRIKQVCGFNPGKDQGWNLEIFRDKVSWKFQAWDASDARVVNWPVAGVHPYKYKNR